jgi:N-glycosylase/DNA lyase
VNAPACEFSFRAREYNLDVTLGCGQAFAWEQSAVGWAGVVSGRRVELRQNGESLMARTVAPQSDWAWLAHYLQTEVDLTAVLATFPNDPHLRAAVAACRGLRLLRQDPWECLASFILSSTKQIVQIRQIVALLSERFGSPVAVPAGQRPAFAFPPVARLASATEAELRACKMGFRAPYLLTAARRIATGECDLQRVGQMSVTDARAELLKLPGVGKKIADCVLLFGYGFPTAFPVDVWVAKALSRFYFRERRVRLAKLRTFAAKHFGPNAGYAQQYLFYYIRTQT